MSEIYGTFSTAYVEAMRLRLSALEAENKGLAARVAELEAENKGLRDRVAELEARCKRMEEAGDKMHWAFMHPFDTAHESVPDAWTKAKEAKP